MANLFTKQTNTATAFINIVEDKQKITDTEVLSKHILALQAKIDNGTVKLECFLNAEGEPVIMIRL